MGVQGPLQVYLYLNSLGGSAPPSNCWITNDYTHYLYYSGTLISYSESCHCATEVTDYYSAKVSDLIIFYYCLDCRSECLNFFFGMLYLFF